MPAMVAMQNIMSAMIASMSFEANVALQCSSDNRYAACKPASVAMCTSDDRYARLMEATFAMRCTWVAHLFFQKPLDAADMHGISTKGKIPH